MDHYKISKLLNDSTVSKFVTKMVQVNDLSNCQYSVKENIRLKKPMLKSYLCDYSDSYIVVKGPIDLLAAAANENYKAQKNVTSKINSTLIDNVGDLDIVMPMYNLLEYSQNYSMISVSLWNYYRDKIIDIDDSASDDELCEYKTKKVGKIPQRYGNEGDAT